MQEEKMPQVNRQLEDPRDFIRLGTLAGILASQPRTLPDLQLLVRCLEDPNADVRRLAVEVLAMGVPDTVDALTLALSDAQPYPVRIGASMALARTGPSASSAVEALGRCLHDGEKTLRWHASFALGKIGEPAVPSLRACLSETEPAVVTAAANSLEWIGRKAKDAAQDLVQAAEKAPPASNLQQACLAALVSVTGDTAAGVPVFLKNLQEGDENAKIASLQELEEIAPIAADSVPYLFPCLQDASGKVRMTAAKTLAAFGSHASTALSLLEQLAQDPDEAVSKAAHSAIERISAANPGD